jgi:hypothetical protein
MLRQLTLAFAVVVLLSGRAAAQTTVETDISARALVYAERYLQPKFYTYQPQAASDERAASTVAVTAHILLEAWRVNAQATYLAAARVAGDSLIGNPDVKHTGKTGWGRFWDKDGGASMPGDGSNTSFAMGCPLARNKPYDDEMYDDARIGHFLLDLYLATKDQRYLDVTRKMLDDTWDIGEATPDGGFFYYKTIGACDRGWHVKNVNMLMAVPVALMAKITGEHRYHDRLAAMMLAERMEVRRMINGQPAPNLGYYAVQTMREHPTQGTYVARAQTVDLNAPVRCNPKTGSGDSCWRHLGLEARSIDLVNRILGHEELATADDVRIVMSDVVATDTALCGADKSPAGYARSWTHCAAYYCALRRLEAGWAQLCLDRTRPDTMTPDLGLGLFWGRPDRWGSIVRPKR